MIPWATASALTSDAHTTWPSTLATALSPGGGALGAGFFSPQAVRARKQSAATQHFPMGSLAFMGGAVLGSEMKRAGRHGRDMAARQARSIERRKAMKFYNSIGPNPGVVKMFMAEKGIDFQ